ncbi:MAG: triphosphoribosyl-dephospho-CoA synthase [Planctomycetia bacterium]|nr:triphosphoribosyl-dephospho-CoA synthase [Planctomycetia bacterium]
MFVACSVLSIGQCATLACLLEATAPKVGNVHRGADFEDLAFTDFVASAVVIGPAMEATATTGVGRAIYDAVAATRLVVSTNTNLGIALLFAPLAAVPRDEQLTTASVGAALRGLTHEDSRLVYEAIRLARPGGMGSVETMDVAGEAPADLLAAMRAASDRDLVARQYVEDFRLVLDEALPALIAGRELGWPLTEAIIHTHLSLIARCGDSLIARKCGVELAGKTSMIAKQVLDCGAPGNESYYEALADFDFWLRSDGNRRNPGTTADLLAAALFAGLRDGLLSPPWR